MKLCGIKINKIKYYSLFSAFVYHVPQFLEMHGTLMQFNCQPVEKKNHWQSKAFHRGSQKSVRTFRLWQIIQLFSSTVALFTNASRNCVNFVSAMLIEHRPLPTLYQKSCIIFTDILTANYILEIGRRIANLPEKWKTNSLQCCCLSR